MKDAKNNPNLIICIAALAVLGLLFVGSVVALILNHTQPAAAQKEYQALAAEAHTGPATVDFSLLSEKNPDIRAWIISEGTGIDYPIVQSEDDGFYRRHLFSGKSNPFGCLRVDAAQPADFSARNTVIHGGAQLNSIHKYARQDYYELLPSMTLCTPDETYTVLLYAGFTTEDIPSALRTEFADSAEFADYLSWLKDNSLFYSTVSVSESDRLVTLCAGNGEEGFVLVGKLA